MRVLKIVLLTFILGGLAFLVLNCAPPASETTAESQIVTVGRGDLRVDITSSGNLAFTRKEDLTFEMAGTVTEVLVDEGDSVVEGQVLAKLDATSEWEKQLKTLEEGLVAAQRNLTTKERNVTKAERQVTAKEFAVRQAELDLQTAENNIGQIANVKAAQDAVDNAENDLKIAQALLQGGADPGVSFWSERIVSYKELLAKAKKDLQEILSGSSVQVSSDVALQVAKSQLQVEQSQMKLEDAGIAVEDAKLAVDDAKLAKADAQQAVKDAQEELDEVKGISTIVKAPFAGVITKVNSSAGDEVKKGVVAMTIADPVKFEADTLVSEMDIFKVPLGAEAQVQVDAVSGLSFPAKVTRISPTATIQQGVVNYKVRVEIESLQSVMQQRQRARGNLSSDNTSAGQLSERFRQAMGEGRFTQEQLEEMMKRRQQAQAGQSGQMPAMLPEDFQLREGMSVTVSIIIQERNNVLLVPNQAITSQGGQTSVQVVKDGAIEKRTIRTGVSNWQYTEVLSGLSEGEKMLLPKTTTTSTTGQQRPPAFPGMGRGFMR